MQDIASPVGQWVHTLVEMMEGRKVRRGLRQQDGSGRHGIMASKAVCGVLVAETALHAQQHPCSNLALPPTLLAPHRVAPSSSSASGRQRSGSTTDAHSRPLGLPSRTPTATVLAQHVFGVTLVRDLYQS